MQKVIVLEAFSFSKRKRFYRVMILFESDKHNETETLADYEGSNFCSLCFECFLFFFQSFCV